MYIITGASFGIGHAVAAALASRGCLVLAVARSSQPLADLAERFPQLVHPLPADLSTRDGVESIVAAVREAGEVSGVLHSAGSRVTPEPFCAINAKDLVEHFRVHVASQIELTRMLTRRVSVRRMFFIDSYSACEPREGWAAYSIIKAAAQMAARCAARELPDMVVTRVLPGAVRTAVVDSVIASDAKAADVFKALDQAGKVALPNDVARFIAAMFVDASDELLRSNEAWDYNNLEHRELLKVTA